MHNTFNSVWGLVNTTDPAATHFQEPDCYPYGKS